MKSKRGIVETLHRETFYVCCATTGGAFSTKYRERFHSRSLKRLVASLDLNVLSGWWIQNAEIPFVVISLVDLRCFKHRKKNDRILRFPFHRADGQRYSSTSYSDFYVRHTINIQTAYDDNFPGQLTI